MQYGKTIGLPNTHRFEQAEEKNNLSYPKILYKQQQSNNGE